MFGQNNNNPYGNTPNRYLNDNTRIRALELMATGSMACALLGLVASMFGIGFMFGAIAIALGLLSRGGSTEKCAKLSKRGIIFGSIALVLGIIILVNSYISVISQYGSLSDYYDAYMEYYYGTDDGTEL